MGPVTPFYSCILSGKKKKENTPGSWIFVIVSFVYAPMWRGEEERRRGRW
jgi:hypothetical protein